MSVSCFSDCYTLALCVINANTLWQQDEHVFLGAASALRRLLDVVVRDRMTFLLPDHALPVEDAAASSASQKETLAHQQALRDLLPPAFQQRFRQKLLDQCVPASCMIQ